MLENKMQDLSKPQSFLTFFHVLMIICYKLVEYYKQ